MKRMFLAASALLSVLLSSFSFAIIENGSCPEPLVPNKSFTITPGVLTVGMQINLDPLNGFSFTDPVTGHPDGFDIRVACLFAKCLGLSVVVKNLPQGDLEGALLSGGIDIILSQQVLFPSTSAAYEQVPYGGTPSVEVVTTRAVTLSPGISLTDALTTLAGMGSFGLIATIPGTAEDVLVRRIIDTAKLPLGVVQVADAAEGQRQVSSGNAIAFVWEGLVVEPTNTTLHQTSVTVPVVPSLALKAAIVGSLIGPVSAGIVKSNCGLINAFANFVRLNEKELATLAEQFTPAYPFNASDLTFTPQACQLTQFDPCVGKCPFLDAIREKLCGVTGACPIKVINLLP